MKGINKILHYLFNCPTFWKPWKWIICPECSRKMVCYWDGNDCDCGVINLCGECYIEHVGKGHSKDDKDE